MKKMIAAILGTAIAAVAILGCSAQNGGGGGDENYEANKQAVEDAESGD